MIRLLLAAVMLLSGCGLHPKTLKRGEYEAFCRPQCVCKVNPFCHYRECAKEGDRDYCTKEKYVNGKWEPSTEPIP